AARIIQTAWRSYRNRRIFTYYRDLIRFRERGDPRELLRVINPREAQLVDAAAGIHVRFRLGGTMFPPLVFYKIFTHRPVADICAFGPRDYANEVRVTPGELHNHRPAAAAAATTGWYERHENNGWRPVSERVLLDEDPVTTMTRLKRQPLFHYNPAVRREQRAKMIKQRRREWLRKMYAEGVGGLRPAGTRNDDIVLGSGPVPDLDLNLGDLEEGQLDEEADELLAWSEHLDYRSYFDDWTSMACTLASEAFV
ncbi:hypothetical protein VOLCADRAFT_32536, partial [Volvox carteri f. nagariensis]